ncbi:MAG: CdaR family protein, partial [Eubacteriales bacterium]
YSGIAVDILNSTILDEQELVYEVVDGTDTVTVYVTATRSVLEDISRDNIYAVADLQDISYLDTVRIQAYTNKNDNAINGITTNIENLKLVVEDKEHTQLVITTNVEGVPSSGYIAGDITMNQNIVRLSGPASVISQVKRAVVDIDISDMSSTVNTSAELKFYDNSNKRIENQNLVANINQVDLSIYILESKNVPIIVNAGGEVAQGYTISGEYRASPSNIQVAGEKSALDSITSIAIPEDMIVLTGATDDVIQAVDLRGLIPNNVQFADENFNGYVNVIITVEEAISEIIEIETSWIQFLNGIEEYEPTLVFEDELSIRVTGTQEGIQALNQDSIRGTIDIANLSSSEIVTDTPYEVSVVWNVDKQLQVELLVPVYVSFVSIEE